jgi:branched-chain amino acid transport system substrate-binding protein
MKCKAICAVVAMLGLAFVCSASRADDQRIPIKIGVLSVIAAGGADYSGKGALVAAHLAVEDFGGNIGGAPIEIINGDTLQKADIASTIVREWFDRDNVDVVVDVPNTSVALAIMELARERNKVVLVSDATSMQITGKRCAPTAINWVLDSYNLAYGTTRAILKRGVDTWFFSVTDLTFGRDLLNFANQALKDGGGKSLGYVTHPYNTPDLSSFLIKAQASQAKAVALADAPPDNLNAIKQAREFQIPQGGQNLIPYILEITDVHSLGLEVAQGMLLTTGFYWDLDDDTRAFAKRYFERVNAMPNMFQAGVYSSVLHYLKAVRAANSKDGRTVIAKMRELPVNDFFAKGGRIREDNRLIYTMYLAQVKTPSESKYAWDYFNILSKIPVEEGFLPLTDSECEFAKK